MSERTAIEITRGDGSESIVVADLLDGLSIDEVDRADRDWEGPFFDIAATFAKHGLSSDELPPSWSWNWRSKMEDEALPEWNFFGIEHNRSMQGMMVVDSYKQPCDHLAGRSLTADALYLCYICAAPWNMGHYLAKLADCLYSMISAVCYLRLLYIRASNAGAMEG